MGSATGRHATCRRKSCCVKSRRGSNTAKRKNRMSLLTAKGNWNIAMGKLKQKFAHLTDDGLQFMEGKENELIGRIQKRTGQAKKRKQHGIDECGGCNH